MSMRALRASKLYLYCMLPSKISISMVRILVGTSFSVMADSSLQPERGHGSGYTSQSAYSHKLELSFGKIIL